MTCGNNCRVAYACAILSVGTAVPESRQAATSPSFGDDGQNTLIPLLNSDETESKELYKSRLHPNCTKPKTVSTGAVLLPYG